MGLIIFEADSASTVTAMSSGYKTHSGASMVEHYRLGKIDVLYHLLL